MSSASKHNAEPDKTPISRSQDLFFRRLTSSAAKYGSRMRSHTSEETSSSSEAVSTTLQVVRALSSLSTRSNRVFAVATGNLRFAVLEENQGGLIEMKKMDLCLKEGDQGGVILTKNLACSTDVVELGTEKEYTWYNNLALRLVEINALPGFKPPISPDRLFSDHLQTIFTCIHDDAPITANQRVLLNVYFLRTGFPKMLAGAGEHFDAMKVFDEDPEEGNSKPAVLNEDEEASIKKQRKKKKKGHVAQAVGDESSATKAAEYGSRLVFQKLPKVDEVDHERQAALASVFGDAQNWSSTYLAQLRALQLSAIPLKDHESSSTLPDDIEPSPNFTALSEYCANKFKTPASPTTLGDIGTIFGTALLVFFSGLKTLNQIWKNHASDAWSEFENKRAAELSTALWFGVKAVATCGYLVNGVCIGEEDAEPMLHIYLQAIFRNEDQVEACLKWLRTTTEHYSSLSVLLSPVVRANIRRCKVSMLDLKFVQDTRDDDMMGVEEFFDDIHCSQLTRNDRLRLSNDLKALFGTHSGLTKFSGTIHAETALLLLCLMVSEGYESMLPADVVATVRFLDPRYIGVSKKCCPVCNEVVKLAERKLDITISYSGAHSTYSACRLPPWIPSVYAQEITSAVEANILRDFIIPRSRKLREALRKTRGSGTPAAPNAETRTVITETPNDDPNDSSDEELRASIDYF
ncbi:hypothetical protein BJ508DRAFT_338968 [Ascobolus immersus RN42]|uniref:Uncharacterized protein n=1 Tax=Ascobolus immersus RN42 TaxID=1160509 RepID=A0A3N4ILF1_ASCIM|nr:hypothetical protein BJ508DRAFT_338968 [Ascobolus immersus RN42]